MPDEIIIKIKRRRRKGIQHSTVSTQPSPSGILRPRIESDYQARRLQNSPLINFYDLGQIRTGETLNDLPYSIVKGFYRETEGSIFERPNPLSLADYDALAGLIFEIDVDDWAMRYKKLEYETADKLGLSVNFPGQSIDFPFQYNARLHPGSLYWKENGLRAKGKISVNNGAITGFDLTDSARSFVTATHNRAAPKVSDFSLTKDADIYLLPAMHYRSAQATGSGIDAVVAGFGVLPRSIFLDLTAVSDFGWGIYRAPFLLAGAGTQVFTSDDPAYIQDLSLDYTDHIRRSFSDVLIGSYAASPDKKYASVDAANVETSPSFTSFPHYPTGLYLYSQMRPAYHTSFSEAVLSAVIKTDNQTFYVWSHIQSEHSVDYQFNFFSPA